MRSVGCGGAVLDHVMLPLGSVAAAQTRMFLWVGWLVRWLIGWLVGW